MYVLGLLFILFVGVGVFVAKSMGTFTSSTSTSTATPTYTPTSTKKHTANGGFGDTSETEVKSSSKSKALSTAASTSETENLKLAIQKDLDEKSCPLYLKEIIIGSFYGKRKEDFEKVTNLTYLKHLHKDIQEYIFLVFYSKQDADYFSVLSSALESGNLVLASYATTFIEDLSSPYGFDLFRKCCKKNNVIGVRFLINANKGIGGGAFNKQLQQQLYPTVQDANPLTIAVKNGSKDVVAELLKYPEMVLGDETAVLSSFEDSDIELLINTVLVIPDLENID